MRLVTLVGFVINFALPTFTNKSPAIPSPAATSAANATQERETVDPKICQ